MADAVTNKVIFQDDVHLHVLLTNVSDGTGESAVAKVDLSALTKARGDVPDHLVIEDVQWAISGFRSVKLAFDHTTDDTALVLCEGFGKLCFKFIGGLHDPKSTGGTGDLLLTTGTVPAGVTGTYTIKLALRKA